VCKYAKQNKKKKASLEICQRNQAREFTHLFHVALLMKSFSARLERANKRTIAAMSKANIE
jgi:hypothetical protein